MADYKRSQRIGLSADSPAIGETTGLSSRHRPYQGGTAVVTWTGQGQTQHAYCQHTRAGWSAVSIAAWPEASSITEREPEGLRSGGTANSRQAKRGGRSAHVAGGLRLRIALIDCP